MTPTPGSAKLTFLVVDDEPSIARALSIALDRKGYKTKMGRSGEEALSVLKDMDVDLMIADTHLPDMPGVLFFESAVKLRPHLSIHTIFMGGVLPDHIQSWTQETGCLCLEKPFELQDLMKAVDKVPLPTKVTRQITVDPSQCGSRPYISGTQIRVTDVLNLLATGASAAQVVEKLPELEVEDIMACLRFASQSIQS
jgi:uncharacterized protein (DUF433 family)